MELFKHHMPIQVRFNDVDQMGHINNAVIMEYFDLGKSNYFEAVGLPVTEGDFTVMIVHYDVDFVGQLLFNDTMEVCSKIEKIGNKSITMLQEVRCGGVTKVVGHTILSGYSRQSHTSMAIPDEIKARINAYEQQ